MYGSHITPNHYIQDTLYANWVWEMLYNRNEDKLALFGPYIEGVPDELVSVEVRSFMFLDTMIQSEVDSELFEQTASTAVLDCIARYVDMYRNIDQQDMSIEDLYSNMIADLYDYLEGC
jgi:hypothetical protein